MVQYNIKISLLFQAYSLLHPSSRKYSKSNVKEKLDGQFLEIQDIEQNIR